MSKKTLAAGAAAIALALGLSACGSTGETAASETTVAQEAEVAEQHNEADVMFAQMMALDEQIKAAQAPELARLTVWLEQWGEPTSTDGHHEGAISTAEDELADGLYPAALEMAQVIIDTQQQEIDDMRAMLAAL